MSTKVVIIALLVALVLGIGAYLVLQPDPKAPTTTSSFAAGEMVCPIEPSSVTLMEVEMHDGEILTIRKAAAGGYGLTISRQGVRGQEWPLEEGRVSSMLRVLSKTPSLGAPDEQAELDPESFRVTLGHDGKTTHLLLNGRTLTGRGLGKVVEGEEKLTLSELRARAGKFSMVDASIINAFRQPGPRMWRDTMVIPGVGPDVARVRLANVDLSMRLARLEGKWLLQEPVAAPADPAKINTLVQTLAAMKIERFGDETKDEFTNTGLGTPIATIVTETDRRTISTDAATAGTVQVRTETREIFVGNPADTDAKTRYAQLGRNGPVVVISTTGLTREIFDPVTYISRKALETPAADIGMLVVERAGTPGAPTPAAATPGAPTPPTHPPAAKPASMVYRRDLDKWKEVTGTTEVVLDDSMTKAVADLLKFLTTEDAASIALQPPTVWTEQGQVVVGSIAGTPLATVVVGSTDGPNLGIRINSGEGLAGTTAVYRWYPREKVPPLLVTLLPKPTEPVKPAAGAEGRDVVK